MLIVAVDFDGTIVDHRFPKIGPAVPGAIDWLKQWQDLGIKIILYTMRSGEYLDQAVTFLRENEIVPWAVNNNPEQHTWTSSRKVYAHCYVDDAAIGAPMIQPEGFERACVDWRILGPLVKQEQFRRLASHGTY